MRNMLLQTLKTKVQITCSIVQAYLTFLFDCLVKIIPLVCKSVIQVLLKPYSVTAQAGSCLTLLETSKTGFLKIPYQEIPK